jgi:hypothetical protein
MSVHEFPGVYVATTSQTPIRVASVGTKFKVVEDNGSEWVRVAFTDPVWGRRVGFVKRAHLKLADDATQPMDLSIPELEEAPDAQAPQGYVPIPQPRTIPTLKNHIVGTGGTFGTRPSMLAGIEASGDVLPMLQVYGSFDWHQDSSPDYFSIVEDISGWLLDSDVSVKVPAYVGMGGVKVLAPTKHIRPYGMGGFGVVHTTVKMASDFGNTADAVASQLLSDELGYTKPMFEVGGGMVVPIGYFYLDAGYKFRKTIQQGDTNMSGVYVGVGASF